MHGALPLFRTLLWHDSVARMKRISTEMMEGGFMSEVVSSK
jgi:hypothetical protein